MYSSSFPRETDLICHAASNVIYGLLLDRVDIALSSSFVVPIIDDKVLYSIKDPSPWILRATGL